LAKEQFGDDFDQIFIDTTLNISNQELIQSITKAYENRSSAIATPAGYTLGVNLIIGPDTLHCEARNSRFLDIFRK
jgi:hypothetical protein